MRRRTFLERTLQGWAASSLIADRLGAMQSKPPVGITELLDGTAMVRVPAGEFRMGSTDGNPDEQPVHRVRITRPFEIGKYEVTQAQWENVMRGAHMGPDVKTNPSKFQSPDLPVESITWDDAQEFLKRLNIRDPMHTYRLPTEAEWEYACRGAGHKGAEPKADTAAWYQPNSEQKTHTVGGKEPNALGLYDMLGNVAEWVHDWYERDYYTLSPAADPTGAETGSYRVYRGGCWYDAAKNCRPAYRGFDLPSNSVYSVGFRVVRVAKA